MPTACSSSNHADISISDNEVDGTDYLLSSTIRLDENFLHALEHIPEVTYQRPELNDLETGAFLLVRFLGGSRNTVNYKYVCSVHEIDNDTGEITLRLFCGLHVHGVIVNEALNPH
ncbi:hypothetical protein QE152_g8695 [Popillia japonica]|uniref:Uncharacterized protein n=1 Tax=Popillia japonica TaxID=7064 RepID=A0AAW1M240_POPJA